jgi:hypothetical protein
MCPPFSFPDLFEPMAYSVVEVNEEPWSFSSPSSSSSLLEGGGCPCPPKEVREEYEFRSELGIPRKFGHFGRELLRVGTSLEDLWAASLQRLLHDWKKRTNALKRDLARDPDPAKVKAYVRPVRKKTFRKTIAILNKFF